MGQVIGWKVIQKLGLLKAYLKVWIEGFFGKVGEIKIIWWLIEGGKKS